MNQIIIFYGILRLIRWKKTTNTNFTGKYFSFDKIDTFIIIAVLILFNKVAQTEIQILILFTYHLGRTAKCFYIYVESVIKIFSDLVANTLTRLPLILLLRLNKLRVPIHNSVNRLWIFDVSWNPKAISKIVLTGSTVNFPLRRVTVSNFTGENTFTALNQYTLMKFSRYFSTCLLDWTY